MGFALFHLLVRIVACLLFAVSPPLHIVLDWTFKLGWAGGFDIRDTTVVVVNMHRLWE